MSLILPALGVFGHTVAAGTTRRALEISGSTGTAGGMTWAAGTPGYTSFTFSAWTYINTGHPNSMTIFAGPSGTVQIYTGNSNTGQINARTAGSGGASTATSVYSTNTWFHLHVTMGAGGISISINGTERGTDPDTLGSTALNGTWYLLEDDGSDADMQGRLFDVGLFNAIMAIGDRNESSGSWTDFGSTTGIICRMDGQTSGDATQDSSGNANHWTQASGGGSVVTSESSLPTGANP